MKFLVEKHSFSSDKKYRYYTEKRWDLQLPVAVLIGLNPSPTEYDYNKGFKVKIVNWCKNSKFGGYKLVNLFAYRSKTPKNLYKINDPVGPENDFYLHKTIISTNTGLYVFWGNHGLYMNRQDIVLKMIKKYNPNIPLYMWGYNINKTPKHPLYSSMNNIQLFQ